MRPRWRSSWGKPSVGGRSASGRLRWGKQGGRERLHFVRLSFVETAEGGRKNLICSNTAASREGKPVVSPPYAAVLQVVFHLLTANHHIFSRGVN